MELQSLFAQRAGSSSRAASPEIRIAPLKAEPIGSAKAQGSPQLIDGMTRDTSKPAKCATPRASSCLLSSLKRAPHDPAPNAKAVSSARPPTRSSHPPSTPRSPLLSTRTALTASTPSTQGGSFAAPLPAKDPFTRPALAASTPKTHGGSFAVPMPTKDPSVPPAPASPPQSARSSLPAALASMLGPPKMALGRALSAVSPGSAQGTCRNYLDRSRAVRVLSPPPSDNLSSSEFYRTEQESGGNVSTTASSVCDSHQGNIDHWSSKMIFAKVSEMIRMDIASCERRMTARLEAERVERNSVCDKMATDLEALVSIVEGLSAQRDQHSIATLLEEERHLRDMACMSLHCKLEALTCLVKKSCTAASMNEEKNGDSSPHFGDDTMLLYASESVDEIPMENRGKPGIRQRTNGSSDLMMSPPTGLIACSKLDEQYLDALLEQERRSRELACATMRTELCKELHGMLEVCTETNLNSLLEHERRARDVACATLRADFCKELEAMSMDVRSIAVRIPQYDVLEREHKDLVMICGRLRDDIQGIAYEARRRWRTTSPASNICNKLTDSPPRGERLHRQDSSRVLKH